MESRELTAWRAMWNYFSGRSDKYRTELDKRESNKVGIWILNLEIDLQKICVGFTKSGLNDLENRN